MADNSSKIDYIQGRLDDVAATVSNIDKEMALQKAAFEAHLKQDEKMYEEFKRMNDILQENTQSLKEHIQRTNLLQDMVVKMDGRFSPIELQHIQNKAVREWVISKAKLIAKLGGAASAIGAIVVWLKPWLIHLLSQ